MSWATVKRNHDKAVAKLHSARAHLEATWTEEFDASWHAEQLLLAAMARLTDELSANRKALGVGTYSPYGAHKAWARKY